MRSLTLLSVLIASSLASPVFHSDNALSRRAATRKEDVIKADVEVANDVEIEKHKPEESSPRRHHRVQRDRQDILDSVDNAIFEFGLDSINNNDELLEALIGLEILDDEDLNILEGFQFIGNYGGDTEDYGLFGNFLDLGIVALSDERDIDEQERRRNDNHDALDINAILFEGYDGGSEEEDGMSTESEATQANVNLDANVDVEAEVEA